MNVAQHFFEAAKQQPNKVAIFEKGYSYFYKDLAKAVRQVAAYLKQQGYKKGDNILVVIPPSVELYVHLLAIFTIGARAVLVDNILPKKRVLYAVKKAECKGVLSTASLYTLLFLFGKPVRQKLSLTFNAQSPISNLLQRIVFSKLIQALFLFVPFLWSLLLTPFSFLAKKANKPLTKNGATEFANIEPVAKDETALITFTSGTTGQPKAANRTHSFLNIQLKTIIDKTKLTAGDVHISSFPVVLLCNLAVGATSIIAPKHGDAQAWQKIKEEFKVNVVSASPHYFSVYQSKLLTQHFEKIIIGGASIYPDFVNALKDKTYANAIKFVYGSTEAEPIATLTIAEYLNYNKANEKGICVGKKHPNIAVKVVAINEGKLLELDEGELGEIIVAGSHVLKTYYKDVEAYAKNKLELEGQIWHRTGDAGYLKNGQLYFFGRMKHCWKQADHFLSPLTLEKFASEQNFTGEATCLNINGKTTAFYAGEKSAFKEMLSDFPYSIDKLLQLKKLPKDKRHRSRVDYESILK